jgi:environmental stress-induced protein Ves
MNYSVIPPENFKTVAWAGGTTTELYIFPTSAEYKLRNFLFRISIATVETEESEFTILPGISRKLMILDGQTTLNHEGNYSVTLQKFDIDTFEGDWKTMSVGKCTDFNLMTTGNTKGVLNGIKVEKNKTLNFRMSGSSNLVFMYVYFGKIGLVMKDERIVLHSDQLLLINQPEIKNLIIEGLETSESVLTEIMLEL